MNLWRLLTSLWATDERTMGRPRSPRWKATRTAWLSLHPTCAACGGTTGLEVHHLLPFWFAPEMELLGMNLLTLCEARGCHLRHGHSFLWTGWNEHAVEDAALMLQRIRERRTA